MAKHTKKIASTGAPSTQERAPIHPATVTPLPRLFAEAEAALQRTDAERMQFITEDRLIRYPAPTSWRRRPNGCCLNPATPAPTA